MKPKSTGQSKNASAEERPRSGYRPPEIIVTHHGKPLEEAGELLRPASITAATQLRLKNEAGVRTKASHNLKTAAAPPEPSGVPRRAWEMMATGRSAAHL